MSVILPKINVFEKLNFGSVVSVSVRQAWPNFGFGSFSIYPYWSFTALVWNIWNYSAVPDISIVFIFQKLGSLRILEKFLFSNFLVSVLLCYKSFLDYLLGAFALLYLHTSSIYIFTVLLLAQWGSHSQPKEEIYLWVFLENAT